MNIKVIPSPPIRGVRYSGLREGRIFARRDAGTIVVPKLPAPKEEDLSKGILEAIDMESYRRRRQ